MATGLLVIRLSRPKHVSAVTKRHVKSHLFMTQLAAGFAAIGRLNFMTSSPVATGLAHYWLIIRFYQIFTRRAMLSRIQKFIVCR